MGDLIKWFNANQGFMSAVLAIIGLFISVTAIAISISTAKRQNRIVLYDKRNEVYRTVFCISAALKLIYEKANCSAMLFLKSAELLPIEDTKENLDSHEMEVCVLANVSEYLRVIHSISNLYDIRTEDHFMVLFELLEKIVDNIDYNIISKTTKKVKPVFKDKDRINEYIEDWKDFKLRNNLYLLEIEKQLKL